MVDAMEAIGRFGIPQFLKAPRNLISSKNDVSSFPLLSNFKMKLSNKKITQHVIKKKLQWPI